MQYTTGNWTVQSLYKDTLTTPKNLSLPDLSYATDYAKSVDEPSEAVISNITAQELIPAETIRFATQNVANVYNNTNVGAGSRLDNPTGKQILIGNTVFYRATNSVTGQEVLLPIPGHIVLKICTHPLVTTELIEDAMKRIISSAFATGSVDASRVVSLARGIMLPTGL